MGNCYFEEREKLMRRAVKREKKPVKKHMRKPLQIQVSEEVLRYRRRFPPVDIDQLFRACIQCDFLGSPVAGFPDGKMLITCIAQNNLVVDVDVEMDIDSPLDCEHAKKAAGID